MKTPICIAVALGLFAIAAHAFPVPDSAIVAGGPDRAFLGAELYVTPGTGIEPGPSGFGVFQIVNALGEAQKLWKGVGKDQWLLTATKTDPVTNRQLIVKMLFVRHRTAQAEGVLPRRVVANDQEFDQFQIFEFVRQLAVKAEAQR